MPLGTFFLQETPYQMQGGISYGNCSPLLDEQHFYDSKTLLCYQRS